MSPCTTPTSAATSRSVTRAKPSRATSCSVAARICSRRAAGSRRVTMRPSYALVQADNEWYLVVHADKRGHPARRDRPQPAAPDHRRGHGDRAHVLGRHGHLPAAAVAAVAARHLDGRHRLRRRGGVRGVARRRAHRRALRRPRSRAHDGRRRRAADGRRAARLGPRHRVLAPRRRTRTRRLRLRRVHGRCERAPRARRPRARRRVARPPRRRRARGRLPRPARVGPLDRVHHSRHHPRVVRLRRCCSG